MNFLTFHGQRCIAIFRAIAVIFLLGLVQSANAQLSVVLNNSILTALPGQTVTFGGTFTNTGSADLYLNGISFNIPGALTSDDSPFYSVDVPYPLTSHQSYSGDFFRMTLSSSATPGDYIGSATIQGGADSGTLTTLASPGFDVKVIGNSGAAPEPAALALLLPALPLFAAGIRRRAKTIRS